MSKSNVGTWVQADPGKIVGAASEEDGLQVLPSPYDVPLAIRIIEGDTAAPSYVVEIRYIGGGEERIQKRGSAAEFAIEIGRSSGRVYRLVVDAKKAHSDSRTSVIKNIASAIAEVAGFDRDRSNVEMVRRAVLAYEDKLAQQVSRLNEQSGFSTLH